MIKLNDMPGINKYLVCVVIYILYNLTWLDRFLSQAKRKYGQISLVVYSHIHIWMDIVGKVGGVIQVFTWSN